jgi:hypothetical protein
VRFLAVCFVVALGAGVTACTHDEDSGAGAPLRERQETLAVVDPLQVPAGCGENGQGFPALMFRTPVYTGGSQGLQITLLCDGYPGELPQIQYRLALSSDLPGHPHPNYPREYRILNEWIGSESVLYEVRVFTRGGDRVLTAPAAQLEPDQSLQRSLDKWGFLPQMTLTCAVGKEWDLVTIVDLRSNVEYTASVDLELCGLYPEKPHITQFLLLQVVDGEVFRPAYESEHRDPVEEISDSPEQ